MKASALVLVLVVAIAAGCGSSSSSSSSSPGAGTTEKASPSATVIGSRDVDGRAVLVDGSGHTLYSFAHGADCTGKCADAWPPLLADGDVTAKKGSGVDTKLLGTVKRADGELQVTYDKHPLYLLADDEPGKAKGAGTHAFGGAWNVVGMSGNPFEREKSNGPSCEPDCGY